MHVGCVFPSLLVSAVSKCGDWNSHIVEAAIGNSPRLDNSSAEPLTCWRICLSLWFRNRVRKTCV